MKHLAFFDKMIYGFGEKPVRKVPDKKYWCRLERACLKEKRFMDWIDAIVISAGATTLLFFALAELFSLVEAFTPETWKLFKIIRLHADYKSPLDGQDIPEDIKIPIEEMFSAYSAADVNKLPYRMSKPMRSRAEHRIEMLRKRGLRPTYRFVDAHLYPDADKKKFIRENDSGREWREATVCGTLLERLVTVDGQKKVWKLYHNNAAVRILQSRHIHCGDQSNTNGKALLDKRMTNCPSCGAEVKLNSREVLCEYCGAVIQNRFYDWQTESFELFDIMSDRTQHLLTSLGTATSIFVPCVFCFHFIPVDWLALLVAVLTALACSVASLSVFASIFDRKDEHHKNLEKEIVRYSENHLRSCIEEELWKEVASDTLYDKRVSNLRLNTVSSSDDTTEIDVTATITETVFPEKGRPIFQKYNRRLIMSRAKYPNRLKGKGRSIIEKDCPSCGANFTPDENNCCSYCGYGLQVDNAKWVVSA